MIIPRIVELLTIFVTTLIIFVNINLVLENMYILSIIFSSYLTSFVYQLSLFYIIIIVNRTLVNNIHFNIY